MLQNEKNKQTNIIMMSGALQEIINNVNVIFLLEYLLSSFLLSNEGSV